VRMMMSSRRRPCPAQRRQADDADIVGGKIGEPSRHDIVEMMMRLGVRVVDDFGRIHDQLPDQLPLQEEFQRVVDGCLRCFSVAELTHFRI